MGGRYVDDYTLDLSNPIQENAIKASIGDKTKGSIIQIKDVRKSNFIDIAVKGTIIYEEQVFIHVLIFMRFVNSVYILVPSMTSN